MMEGSEADPPSQITNAGGALKVLEVAAARIKMGPQTGPESIAALRLLRGRVARWRLLYLWEYLEFDAATEPNRLIGAQQNLNAALNGIALDLRMTRIDIRLVDA